MKAFERNDRHSRFKYPEDMRKIMNYLSTRGTINISAEKIEELYGEYSDIWAASWLEPEDYVLDGFANWLTGYEIV